MKPEPKPISADLAAVRIGRSRKRVYGLVKEGVLRARRDGRSLMI